MIEELAKAFLEAGPDQECYVGDQRDPPDDLASMTIDGKLNVIAGVRAILTRLREPTPEMIEAAGERWNYADNGGRERRDFEHEWRAAIDAIAEQGR